MESLEEKLLNTIRNLENGIDSASKSLQILQNIRPEELENETEVVISENTTELQQQVVKIRSERDALKERYFQIREEIANVYKNSIGIKIEGFVKTMWLWARGGFKMNRSLGDKRFSMCQACPHFEDPRCTLCGCFMQAKTKIPQASCPVGKWTAEVDGEDTIVTKFLKRTGLKKTDPPQ